MANAYEPKLLRVNLTTGAIREEDVPGDVVANFVGGRGLGIKYMYNELSPRTDPLGEGNKLLFSIGPQQIRIQKRFGRQHPSRHVIAMLGS